MRVAASGMVGMRERAARSSLRSEVQRGKLGLKFSSVGAVVTCTIY